MIRSKINNNNSDEAKKCELYQKKFLLSCKFYLLEYSVLGVLNSRTCRKIAETEEVQETNMSFSVVKRWEFDARIHLNYFLITILNR